MSACDSASSPPPLRADQRIPADALVASELRKAVAYLRDVTVRRDQLLATASKSTEPGFFDAQRDLANSEVLRATAAWQHALLNYYGSKMTTALSLREMARSIATEAVRRLVDSFTVMGFDTEGITTQSQLANWVGAMLSNPASIHWQMLSQNLRKAWPRTTQAGCDVIAAHDCCVLVREKLQSIHGVQFLSMLYRKGGARG